MSVFRLSENLEKLLAAYPMVVANRSTLVEKIFFNHAVKDMSEGQERYVNIIHCHLSTGQESVYNR